MKHHRVFIACCCFYLLSTQISHAAGIIMRIQQMKAMKQQRQAMLQGQYQQGVQGQDQQAAAPAPAPAPPTYQQTIDQRNQAIAQAILDEHNPSVSTQAQTPLTANSAANDLASQQALVAKQSTADVKDVVDLAEVWKKLDKKSTVWTLLIDDQAKVLTVSEFIDRYHKQGVKINGQPSHYVQMIDQIVTQNPNMLDRPFGELVKIAAIVDYDFDNGMNKDDLARKALGEAGYEANKKRFSQ